MTELPTSGPRPLQLISGSILNSQSFSTESPSSPNASGPSVVTKQPETNAQTETENLYRIPFHTPPSSARVMSRSSRRHSSISYIRSGSGSPFQESFRRESMDVFMKSPLASETHPPSQVLPAGQSTPGSPMSDNNPPTGPVSRDCRVSRASNRASRRSLLGDSKMADAMKHLKERPPVTVAEKHAELLNFIAQKESKCLELRSQLAVHEAELLQLKRKWELIVNRGCEKSSPSPSSIPSSALALSSPFVSPTSASAPQTASSPYFPLLPGAHAPVLEGIKEGVQGMSRLLAAGFESIAGGPIEPPHLSHQTTMSLHQPPLPLLLGSAPKLNRKASKRHGQNESQSSTSTSASSASESAATTNTSIRSSFSFEDSAAGTVFQAAPQFNNDEKETDSLENGEEQRSKNTTPASDRSEQVLIVRDTGATPTMSPNPDFERKRRSKKLNEKQGRPLTGGPVKKSTRDDEDFDPWLDDSWGEFSCRERQVSRPSVNGHANSTAAEISTMMVQSSSLPPMSTIPGLATMNLAGPAAQQVGSWMGTFGKKLGEIRDSSTFTKSQKRASLLLSDMQNTLVSSLISPTSAPLPSLSSAKGLSSNNNTSLLDESDGEFGTGHADMGPLTTPVLVPSTSSPSSFVKIDGSAGLETREGGSKGGSESDDDWNW